MLSFCFFMYKCKWFGYGHLILFYCCFNLAFLSLSLPLPVFLSISHSLPLSLSLFPSLALLLLFLLLAVFISCYTVNVVNIVDQYWKHSSLLSLLSILLLLNALFCHTVNYHLAYFHMILFHKYCCAKTVDCYKYHLNAISKEGDCV